MKKKILAIIGILIILNLICIFFSSNRLNNLFSVNDNEFAAEETIDYSEVGENAKVASSIITKRVTGVGPFDTETDTDSQNSDGTVTWTAGNDVSEDDNIVRSFDQITWTIENTMSLKETATQENFKGGILEVKAVLPENCKNLVEWDLESMAWAENAVVSEEGTVLTAQYSMTEEEITVPGKQTLVLVLKILGATNGLEITPTFSISLNGNEESDVYVVKDSTTYVSAAPNYNIKLVRNSYLSDKATVDYNGEEITGRMYGYAVILQLYNKDASKGLKGIEYPTGNINFDINLKLERTLEGSSAVEDITDVCTPLLWNYKINKNSTTGNIDGRTMYFNSSNTYYAQQCAPWGTLNSNRKSCVYNSGNIVMTQDEKTLNATISGYDIDGIFPQYNCNYTTGSSIIYKENIGCFSVGYFQLLVPYNEESLLADRSYYLTVSDSNFKATSISNQETTSQIVTTDDSDKVQHVIYKAGSFSHHIYLYNTANTSLMHTTITTGDSYAARGQLINARSYFSVSQNNEPDDYIYTVDRLFKFDGDGLEPTQSAENYYVVSTAAAKTMNFKMWFVTKTDGTNWESQTERNNAQIEDLVMYENYEDIPDGYLCIGEYFESTDGYLAPMTSWDQYYFNIYLKVKDTATFGETYGITQTSRYWRDDLDRTIYSQSVTNGYDNYPTATWQVLNRNYIKTEYDENGSIVSGTHYNGYSWGQTVLVVGCNISTTKTSIDPSTGASKVNYDFSKNEYNVTYKITPTVSNSNVPITGITLKVEDKLPSGMSYVAGSCEYGDPEIISNSDGTTTLRWYKYGVTAGQEIEPIVYQAHLSELIENGTILDSSVVVSEVPEEDSEGNKIYKVGNTAIDKRTYTTSIQIINLSSYSLYKTTETPVIEINGVIHYKITAINKTDEEIEDFQLLDILPYNGDNRGTSFNGTYTVDRIEMNQINTVTNESLDNSNLNLYITGDESVRSGVTAKDENLGTGSIWSEITSGTTLNDELTGYAVTGSIAARTKLEVDIYLQTNGNKPYDNYKNSATAQTDKETEVMETSVITVQDIKRKLEGKVWFDSNKDGLISDGEELLSNVKVTLINEDGSQVTDIHGEEIATIETDANGEYSFEDMPKGNYKVQVEVTDAEHEITLKEIGSNKEINNKFNLNGYTDTITSLNSIENPVITESDVNAGITYKDTSVIVHHYKEGTTESLSPDVVINGKIHDDYEAEEAEVPEYYELVEEPANKAGTMTLDPIEVVYYYKLKKYDYIVNYLEKDTNKVLSTSKTVKDITYGTNITSSNEIIQITGYNYNSIDKNILTIGTTGNEINIYYVKGTFNYTIEYYYENQKDDGKTETGTATYQDIINSYTDKVEDGYKLDKEENYPLTITENETSNVIKVYYVIDESQTKDLSYIVEYYKDGTKIEEETETTTVQLLEPNTLIVDKTKINTSNKYPGYKLEKTEPGTIPDTVNDGDIIKIYYVKDQFKYTIEYYYENQKDDSKTETGTATYQDTINSYTDKVEDGYILEKEENLPLTITENEANNIIKIYYVIDESQTKDLSYTVEYYKDGTKIEEETENVTVQLLEPNTLTVDKTKINTSNKYPGYKLEKTEPETIPDAVNNGDIIRIYYVKDQFEYTVEYYYDGKIDNSKTETEIATYQDIIEKYTDKNKAGYKLEKEENLPLTITEYPTLNVIKIYYIRDTFNYAVEYYYDGVFDRTKTEIKEGTYAEEITEYQDKPEYGYEFEKIENFPLILSENSDDNIIKIYYTRKDANVIVKYVDKISGEEITEETVKTGKVFDNYDVTEEQKEIPGYTLIELPEELTGTYTEEDQIKIYYYAKNTEVIVKYLEKDTNLELTEEDRIEGYEGKEYISKEKNIKNYTYIESTENTEGVMTQEPIEVIHYYLQNTKVTVNHIDKNTGKILETVEQTGLVGDGYTSSSKDISEYILVEKPEQETVIMGKEEIIINYYYVHVSAGVLEKHIDFWSEEILENNLYEGNEGDSYSTTEKEFEGYDIVTNEMYYKEMIVQNPKILEENEVTTLEELLSKKNINAQDPYIPENKEGKMKVELVKVNYYYTRKTSVRVEYIDKITGEKILEVDEQKGEIKDSTEYYYGNEGQEYKTKEKYFENYVIVEDMYPENNEGIMKTTKDENGNTQTETVVQYYYVKVSGGVIEKHIDIKTGKLLEDETVYIGHEGDPYSTEEKEFDGYDIITIPENAEGTMTVEEIQVNYYYIRKTNVIVEYIDKNTGEKLLEKIKSDDGSYVEEDSTEIIEGHEGDSYKTEEKVFENYKMLEVDGKTDGEMTVNEKLDSTTYVKYYYVHNSSGVTENHIDVITGELLEKKKHEGYEGDLYSTTEKEFNGYELVKDKYPENAEGKMTIEEIVVNYYYIRKITVKVEYLEINTNKVLAKTEIIEGHEGDKYKTVIKDINGFNIITEKIPSNREGTLGKENIIIRYYYESNTSHENTQIVGSPGNNTTSQTKTVSTPNTGDTLLISIIEIMIGIILINTIQLIISKHKKY